MQTAGAYKTELRKIYTQIEQLQQRYLVEISEKDRQNEEVVRAVQMKHEDALLRMKKSYMEDLEHMRSEYVGSKEQVSSTVLGAPPLTTGCLEVDILGAVEARAGGHGTEGGGP